MESFQWQRMPKTPSKVASAVQGLLSMRRPLWVQSSKTCCKFGVKRAPLESRSAAAVLSLDAESMEMASTMLHMCSYFSASKIGCTAAPVGGSQNEKAASAVRHKVLGINVLAMKYNELSVPMDLSTQLH